MLQRTILRLEHLEDRVVPAVYGLPWADAAHLTVSFALDGTLIDKRFADGNGTTVSSTTSNLFARLDTLMPRAVWQGEILRALQTWVTVANLNASLVSDSGDALGTPGAVQGDARFGDIRIAGRSLGANSVSTAVPFSVESGTWSGDILFNTDALVNFGATDNATTYDLYSVALHEFGHALGLSGNLSNPNSAMFEYYTGKRTGLSASDVVAIQSLYGARQADDQEVCFGNNFVLTATDYIDAARDRYSRDLSRAESTVEAAAIPRVSLNGDLTTASDTDWYYFRATGNNREFSITLTTGGVSLANARLTVYDVLGRVVGQGTTSATGQVPISTNGSAPLGVYLFRVDAAPGTAFAVGGYKLSLNTLANGVAGKFQSEFQSWNSRSNDTIGTATKMERADQDTASRPTFFAGGSLDRAGDVDIYRVKVPANGSALQVTLQLDNESQSATVELLNAAGQVIATAVRANGGGAYVLRAEGLTPGLHVFLRVTGTGTPGRYGLSAQFNVPPSQLSQQASGTLTPEEPQAFQSVTVSTTTLLTLELEVTGAPGQLVEFGVYDAHGHFLFKQLVAAGSPVRVQALLGPGSYTVRFVGGLDESTSYTLFAQMENDPIGPRLLDPNAPPPPRDLIPDWLVDVVLVLRTLIDPYGRAFDVDGDDGEDDPGNPN